MYADPVAVSGIVLDQPPSDSALIKRLDCEVKIRLSRGGRRHHIDKFCEEATMSSHFTVEREAVLLGLEPLCSLPPAVEAAQSFQPMSAKLKIPLLPCDPDDQGLGDSRRSCDEVSVHGVPFVDCSSKLEGMGKRSLRKDSTAVSTA